MFGKFVTALSIHSDGWHFLHQGLNLWVHEVPRPWERLNLLLLLWALWRSKLVELPLPRGHSRRPNSKVYSSLFCSNFDKCFEDNYLQFKCSEESPMVTSWSIFSPRVSLTSPSSTGRSPEWSATCGPTLSFTGNYVYIYAIAENCWIEMDFWI